MLLETLLTNVGPAIAKTILKHWLKDYGVAADVGVEIVDILKSKVNDIRTQRQAERQFSEIGDRIAESLLPIIEQDVRLTESERVATTNAVAETINRAELTTKEILECRLNPKRLAEYLSISHPNATSGFFESQEQLYKYILNEISSKIVDVSAELPSFSEQSIAEILRGQDRLLLIVQDILERTRHIENISQNNNPSDLKKRFEQSYRETIKRKFDRVELFGVDDDRNYPLSIAYVTLSAIQKSVISKTENQEDHDLDFASKSEHKISFSSSNKATTSVETILATSQRLILCGSAGSGKTTLMQWIAVRSAAQDMPVNLLGVWKDTIPFFIRLREWSDKELPRPEQFLESITPMLVGNLPDGWITIQLQTSRALILIDGVDELPQNRREDLLKWLDDLVFTFPNSRYIITSRPEALSRWPHWQDWIEQNNFDHSELQPMDMALIQNFIRYWHTALKENSTDPEEQNRIDVLAVNLNQIIRQDRTLRNLATSPLLCAMICALHRQRRGAIPSERVKLYEAGCDLLLNRRDRERGIVLSDYPTLRDEQKWYLLQGFAYWLLCKGTSEVRISETIDYFRRRSTHMNLPASVTAERILRLFVDRSGIIREPVVDKIDFVHRTFQEFLAARSAIDDDNTRTLLDNAHDDQWRQTIILAVGQGNTTQRGKLLNQLIDKGNKHTKHRHRLHILAVACLENCVELRPEVRRRIMDRFADLVPPKNYDEATALATLGESAIPHLKVNNNYDSETAARCIYTLALIGGDIALKILIDYASDTRDEVISQLISVWDNFDRVNYAREVLSKAIKYSPQLELDHVSSVDGLEQLTDLTDLVISNCSYLTDISPISALINLKRLELVECTSLINLTPLSNLSRLKHLYLSECEQVNTLEDLSNLTNLEWLVLWDCHHFTDLRPLSKLHNITRIDLWGCTGFTDLTPLTELHKLEWLNLRGCMITSITPLENLTNLKILNLGYCNQIDDFSPISSILSLTSLDVRGCTNFADLSIIFKLRNLAKLDVTETKVQDLSPLQKMPNSLKITSSSKLYTHPNVRIQ